jgi:hypothetical protein
MLPLGGAALAKGEAAEVGAGEEATKPGRRKMTVMVAGPWLAARIRDEALVLADAKSG